MYNDIINTGAISGAILDADSPEAVEHAAKYYEAIRKSAKALEGKHYE